MPSLAPQFIRTQCLSCLRRATFGFNEGSLQAIRQQLRGKKKLAKSETIKVRLLADIPRYGRQGAIIPIASGRMRNVLFPKRLAEYVTASQLRELGMINEVFERDHSFGSAQSEKSADFELERATEDAKQVETPIPVKIDLLKPERAIEVISTLLPPRIEFYRTPKTLSSPAPKRRSPSLPATSAVSAAAQEENELQTPQKIEIYGSITTADIVDNIKSILAEDIEGIRVVLSSEDVKILDAGKTTGRIKHLGEFVVLIGNKGTTEEVRRVIKVSGENKN